MKDSLESQISTFVKHRYNQTPKVHVAINQSTGRCLIQRYPHMLRLNYSTIHTQSKQFPNPNPFVYGFSAIYPGRVNFGNLMLCNWIVFLHYKVS